MSEPVQKSTCKFHCLDLGEPNKGRLPVLFMHGWGITADAFLPSLRILARERRVVAPDLPGFGRTRCDLQTYDYAQMKTLIARLLDDLGLERLHIVGHSIGAGVGMLLARDDPERIASLVLVDSSGVPFGSLLSVLIQRPPRLFEQLVVQFLAAPRNNPRYWSGWAYNFLFHPWSSLRTALIPIYTDLRPVARQLRQPALVLWGRKDRTTPLSMGIELAGCLPNATLSVVPGCRYHEWSVLYPELFAARVTGFLDKVEQV